MALGAFTDKADIDLSKNEVVRLLHILRRSATVSAAQADDGQILSVYLPPCHTNPPCATRDCQNAESGIPARAPNAISMNPCGHLLPPLLLYLPPLYDSVL